MFAVQMALVRIALYCYKITMQVARTLLVLKTLLAATLLWVQAAGLADAATHGDQPHKHSGITCDMHTLAQAPVVLPELLIPPYIHDTDVYTHFILVTAPAWLRPPGRAPPPRSPPTSQ